MPRKVLTPEEIALLQGLLKAIRTTAGQCSDADTQGWLYDVLYMPLYEKLKVQGGVSAAAVNVATEQ